MNSYVKHQHDELVSMYEKLMCSLGYSYKKFKKLGTKYKIGHDTFVPKGARARTFYVNYNHELIKCAIIIVPDNTIYLTYKRESIGVMDIKKILISSSVKRFQKLLSTQGNLNGF